MDYGHKVAPAKFGKTQQFVKSGTNPGHQAKNGTYGHPGRPVIFLELGVKNRDCPRVLPRSLDLTGII